MLEDRSVTVVVPAYAEEDHVERVLATMPSFVDRIIVVDDGSPDATSARARASGDPRLTLCRHPRRRGVGAAIATGYAAALALPAEGPEDAIAVMAGDGQMHPGDLERVILPIVRGEADYVKGQRFTHRGVVGTMGLPRWFGGQVFSKLTSLAIRQSISDSQCGFTALSRRAAGALALSRLWPSFGYPNDLLGQLAARGFTIAEVTVRPVYGTEKSKLRIRHLPPILWLIGRAALRVRMQRQMPRDRTGGAERATRVAPTEDANTKDDRLPDDSPVSS